MVLLRLSFFFFFLHREDDAEDFSATELIDRAFSPRGLSLSRESSLRERIHKLSKRVRGDSDMGGWKGRANAKDDWESSVNVCESRSV